MRRRIPGFFLSILWIGLLVGPIGSGCDDQGAEHYRPSRSDLHNPPADTATQAGPANPAPRELTIHQFHMGMRVYLTVWTDRPEQAKKAIRQAFERIRRLNLVFSDYEPYSELSRLCRRAGQGPVPVSDELFDLLQRARRLAEQTGGLYDPTAGPVIRLWRQARKTARLPDRQALQQALARTGWRKMKLDAEHRTVELTVPGMQLDLGAIAKGYAGDQALATLKAQGFARAMYEAGGDMVLGDPPPGRTGWAICPPQPDPPLPELDHMELANCAISVSGDTSQFVIIDGKRYSHVVNPLTGLGLTNRAMCIVIAPDGTTSDPLATVGTLLPADRFASLLRRHYPQVKRYWRFPAPPNLEPPAFRIPPPHLPVPQDPPPRKNSPGHG